MDELLKTGFNAYLNQFSYLFAMGLFIAFFAAPILGLASYKGVAGQDETKRYPNYTLMSATIVMFLFGVAVTSPILFSTYKPVNEPTRHTLTAIEGKYKQYQEGSGLGSGNAVRFALDGEVKKVQDDYVTVNVTDKEPFVRRQTAAVFIPYINLNIGQYVIYDLYVPEN